MIFPTHARCAVKMFRNTIAKSSRFCVLKCPKTSLCLCFVYMNRPDSLDKDADGLLSVNINMNYFTDSAALQQVGSSPSLAGKS